MIDNYDDYLAAAYEQQAERYAKQNRKEK